MHSDFMEMVVAVAAVDGIIYAIGGSEGKPAGDRDLSTVEAYDLATDTWTTAANLPIPRSGLTAAVVNGKIYAIGGRQDPEDPTLSIVEEYDPGL